MTGPLYRAQIGRLTYEDVRSIPMVVPYGGEILSGQGMVAGAFSGVAASDVARSARVECEAWPDPLEGPTGHVARCC